MKSKSMDRVPSNTKVRVLSLSAGRHARDKLMGLANVPGESLGVKKNERGGPLIVDIHGSKTVLGLGLAKKVIVTIVEAD